MLLAAPEEGPGSRAATGGLYVARMDRARNCMGDRSEKPSPQACGRLSQSTGDEGWWRRHPGWPVHAGQLPGPLHSGEGEGLAAWRLSHCPARGPSSHQPSATRPTHLDLLV